MADARKNDTIASLGPISHGGRGTLLPDDGQLIKRLKLILRSTGLIVALLCSALSTAAMPLEPFSSSQADFHQHRDVLIAEHTNVQVAVSVGGLSEAEAADLLSDLETGVAVATIGVGGGVGGGYRVQTDFLISNWNGGNAIVID